MDSQHLRRLTQAYNILEQDAPHLADELEKTILDKLPFTLSPKESLALFCDLPQTLINAAVVHETPFTPLFERGKPYLPDVKFIPRCAQHGPIETFQAFIDAGLDLSALSPKDALKYWFTKGQEFGKSVWKQAYPRKDPILGYFEEHALHLPDPIHPDAVPLFAAFIKSFTPYTATRKLDGVMHRNGVDWRIFLAFKVAGTTPGTIDMPYKWQPSLKGEDDDIMRALFTRQSTAHAKIAQQKRLANGPTVEEILSMDRDNRPTLKTLFPA